ncbi:hypothetical protein, partial [Luteitalea sp.]|uniref:hypothetical protein n=1 Tax=Luteitalea sp. TaxID=2004800 RepID=UPI0025C2C87B
MLIDVLRLTTAWFQHGTHGINAQLAALDYDGSDTAPANIVTFADEVTQDEAARGQIPATVPALVTTVESLTMVNNQTATEVGDGTIVLNVRIAVSDPDAWEAKRNGAYYLRALHWSLRRWVREAPDGVNRARNQVAVLEIGAVEGNALYEQVGDVLITAGARIPLTV